MQYKLNGKYIDLDFLVWNRYKVRVDNKMEMGVN